MYPCTLKPLNFGRQLAVPLASISLDISLVLLIRLIQLDLDWKLRWLVTDVRVFFWHVTHVSGGEIWMLCSEKRWWRWELNAATLSLSISSKKSGCFSTASGLRQISHEKVGCGNPLHDYQLYDPQPKATENGKRFAAFVTLPDTLD